jgi:hypothetical protein
MKFELLFEKSDKAMNWKLSLFGMIYLITRFYLFNAFHLEPGNMSSPFEPEVMHTSYYISICIGLAMVCSFRVKLLNVLPVLLFPVVLFSFPSWDIPHLMNEALFSLRWWNALTIHSPILFLGLYMIAGRKVYFSKESFGMALVMILGWFFAIDDKVNTTPFTGAMYLLVAGISLVVWVTICWFFILKDCPKDDPLVAPPIKIIGFKWK